MDRELVSSLVRKIPASSWLAGRKRGWLGVCVMTGSPVGCRMPGIITPTIFVKDLKGWMATPLPRRPAFMVLQWRICITTRKAWWIYCVPRLESHSLALTQYCKVNCSQEGQPSFLRWFSCPKGMRSPGGRKRRKLPFSLKQPWIWGKTALTLVFSVERMLCGPSRQTSLVLSESHWKSLLPRPSPREDTILQRPRFLSPVRPVKEGTVLIYLHSRIDRGHWNVRFKLISGAACGDGSPVLSPPRTLHHRGSSRREVVGTAHQHLVRWAEGKPLLLPALRSLHHRNSALHCQLVSCVLRGDHTPTFPLRVSVFDLCLVEWTLQFSICHILTTWSSWVKGRWALPFFLIGTVVTNTRS